MMQKKKEPYLLFPYLTIYWHTETINYLQSDIYKSSVYFLFVNKAIYMYI